MDKVRVFPVCSLPFVGALKSHTGSTLIWNWNLLCHNPYRLVFPDHVTVQLASSPLLLCTSYTTIQWNLSIKDTLNEGHLSNEDTVCSPNHIDLCTICL